MNTEIFFVIAWNIYTEIEEYVFDGTLKECREFACNYSPYYLLEIENEATGEIVECWNAGRQEL